MHVLLDISQLFFAARANKTTLNYAGMLRRIYGDAEDRRATGFTVYDPKNARQGSFLQMLRDLGVEVHVRPVGENPDFSLELAMLAGREPPGVGVTFVSGSAALHRSVPLLRGPVVVAFFPAQLDPVWAPDILARSVAFVDLRYHDLC